MLKRRKAYKNEGNKNMRFGHSGVYSFCGGNSGHFGGGISFLDYVS